jgi:hypothetical protein
MDRYGATAIWVGCLAGGVVVALLTLAFGPARARRMAELTTPDPEPEAVGA